VPVQGLPSTHGDHHQLNTTTLIRHAARTHPEQRIVFRRSDGEWDSYSYAESYGRIARSANALAALGVGPGDVVGVLDWNSRRHFELYWSIPGTGAVMLQLNLRLTPQNLLYVLEHSGATVVLVDETLLPLAETLAASAKGVKQWVVMADRPLAEMATELPDSVDYEHLLLNSGDQFDWPVIDETSTYSACYTTGTTGDPKGVYYSHRGIYLHTLTLATALRVGSHDCTMLTTPMFHAQSWGLPQLAVYAATKIVLPGRYTVDDVGVIADAMTRERVTVTNGAPTILRPMLDHFEAQPERPDLHATRILCGSTEPPITLMQDYYACTGAEIVHAYGATETTPLVALNYGIKPSLGSLVEDSRWDLKRSQGLPVAGVDIRIVDEDGNDLPHDGVSQGEILLRGPWIIEAYHHLDDQEDRFLDGYWRTGDVGRIDKNGYLKLTDRLKDVIKSGGEWISSIDMENAIVAHPDIADAAVIGVPDPQWQERPLALVVPAVGSRITLEDVTDMLAPQFAKWQLPDRVIVVDQLPRTSVGKLDKKAMRETYAHD
jgi:fatty-acyl-CoA synthase